MLLAATHRPEILDPALLRAGRFDRQVLVDRPHKTGRVQILQGHAKKIRLAAGVDLGQLAALTTGVSGANLAILCAVISGAQGSTAISEWVSPLPVPMLRRLRCRRGADGSYQRPSEPTIRRMLKREPGVSPVASAK